MKCQNCSYKWKPRIENPKACPKCKYYLGVEKRKRKKIFNEDIFNFISKNPKQNRTIENISANFGISNFSMREKLNKLAYHGFIYKLKSNFSNKIYYELTPKAKGEEKDVKKQAKKEAEEMLGDLV